MEEQQHPAALHPTGQEKKNNKQTGRHAGQSDQASRIEPASLPASQQVKHLGLGQLVG